MKSITLFIIGLVVVISSFVSQAITNTAIAVSGTNIVLSWPSYGYESYLVQYRQTLNATDSWSQLVNAYPANSTNRTTLTLSGWAIGSSSGTLSGQAVTSSSSDTNLVAIPPAGTGSAVPLAVLPPRTDLTGFTILDPTTGDTMNGADYQLANPQFNTSTNEPQPLGGPVGNLPATGFFRTFHIPDWLSDFSGYTFDGPTFIPVDYESPDAPVDYVDSTTVLINGQPTDNAMLTPYVYNGVTNWGVGVFFDRFPNGTATIQLLTTVRQSDNLDDQTPYMVFSNNPATITIGNAIAFTNWGDMIFSNAYTFNAQSATPNVDWEIDIYDVNNNFVNSQTGHSSDGNIAWTWGMTDYTGVSRLDDSDPFFYPEITITPSASPGTSTTRPMPAVAAQFPSSGSWLFAYLDKKYDDGTTNYPGADQDYSNGIQLMEGGPLLWGIGMWDYPIKFGRTYSQTDRDVSWQGSASQAGLVDYLQHWTIRNFYYNGHGWINGIGADLNTVDTNDFVTGGITLPGSHAYLTSQWVHDNVTFNRWRGAMPYRFVFLDGCATAATNGNWPWAWSIPLQDEPLSYYQSASNVSGARPSAFVGWDVEIGGSGWGNVKTYWDFRADWMGDWANSYTATLSDSLAQANSDSGWIDAGHFGHLKKFGYTTMLFQGYNHGGDWP